MALKLLTDKVSVVEQMGNEVYIYFFLAEQQFTARISAEAEAQDFKTLDYCTSARFIVNMAKCHIFNYETEQNIFL